VNQKEKNLGKINFVGVLVSALKSWLKRVSRDSGKIIVIVFRDMIDKVSQYTRGEGR
jgi:energy-converting hydrogenase Eha subunit F